VNPKQLIGLAREAIDACMELKAKYEGKIVINLKAILTSITRFIYDDREYIIN
jgi:hypothetical protein